jgi:hypothetical protein
MLSDCRAENVEGRREVSPITRKQRGTDWSSTRNDFFLYDDIRNGTKSEDIRHIVRESHFSFPCHSLLHFLFFCVGLGLWSGTSHPSSLFFCLFLFILLSITYLFPHHYALILLFLLYLCTIFKIIILLFAFSLVHF